MVELLVRVVVWMWEKREKNATGYGRRWQVMTGCGVAMIGSFGKEK